VLMMESTYGNKTHPYLSEALKRLLDLMHETHRNKGNLLIPSFALERTQDVLHQLRIAHEKRRLPPGVKVYLDSPLGIKFTQLYARHPEQMSDSVKRFIKRGESPFRWDDVQFTTGARDSRAIQEITHGAVILAGSGMANGGRILNHLKKNIQREESAVAFVGFQAEGTLGRQLLDGAKEVLIDGERYEVKCKITDIDGFSVHADQPGLLNWASHTGSPHVLLVHGEEEGPLALKAALEEKYNLDVTISEKAKTYTF
jgi:metallo-beta-lactamase family protein